ncbi:MAG: hypothetical protein JNK75_05860, partial [Betaproteobacteria bacterium]|nr:hypothetical protein [Betaproteobacteria bacterium]
TRHSGGTSNGAAAAMPARTSTPTIRGTRGQARTAQDIRAQATAIAKLDTGHAVKPVSLLLLWFGPPEFTLTVRLGGFCGAT